MEYYYFIRIDFDGAKFWPISQHIHSKSKNVRFCSCCVIFDRLKSHRTEFAFLVVYFI